VRRFGGGVGWQWQQWQQLSSFFLGRWDDPDSDDDDGSKPQIIDPTCCGNLVGELFGTGALLKVFGNIIYSSLPTSPSTRCCRCLCVQVYS